MVKAKGVKEFFATSDPEMDKRAREKQKDEEIRREARRKAREARGNYWGGGYGGRAAAGMNRAFLEDDEPGLYDDVGDVGALKRSTKAATNEAIFGESDEEEDDGGDFDSRMKAAGRAASDDEDEDEAPKSATNADIFGESDDDEEMAEAPPPIGTCRTTEAARHRRRGRGRGHAELGRATPRHYTQSLGRSGRGGTTTAVAATPQPTIRTPRSRKPRVVAVVLRGRDVQREVQREEELHLQSIQLLQGNAPSCA